MTELSRSQSSLLPMARMSLLRMDISTFESAIVHKINFDLRQFIGDFRK